MLRRLSTRLIILLAIIVSAFSKAEAQTDPLFTHYFEVPSYYNPAAIGLTDFVRFRAISRLQWVGISHAPTTFALAADMPLKLFDRRWGIGLVLNQDSYGLFSNLGGNIQLAFKQKMFKGELTAAVQIGLSSMTFKGSEVEIDFDDDYHIGQDEAIPTTDISGTAFDIGLGAHYTHRLFWAGVSMLHLNSPSISFGDAVASSGSSESSVSGDAKNYKLDLKPTLYFMGGSNIPVRNTLFEVMPSLLVAIDFTNNTTFEVTARTRWKKFLTFGVGYRYNDAVSVMASGEYKGFFLAYSYDYPLSDIAKLSSGSHEILAGYSLKLDLGDHNKYKHKSIRIL